MFTRTDFLEPWVQAAEEGRQYQPEPQPGPGSGAATAPTTTATTATETPPPPQESPQTPPLETPPAPQPAASALAPVEGLYRGATSQSGESLGLALAAGGARVGGLLTKIAYSCPKGATATLPLRAMPHGGKGALDPGGAFALTVSRGTSRATIAGQVSPDSQSIAGTLVASATIPPYGRCHSGKVVWTAARAQASAASTRSTTYRATTSRGRGRLLLTVGPGAKTITRVRLRAAFSCQRGKRRMSAVILRSPRQLPIPASQLVSLSMRRGAARGSRLVGLFDLSPGTAFGTVRAVTRTARHGMCKSPALSWSTRP